eukprot:4776048-Karenia_brevis.AAC.1
MERRSRFSDHSKGGERRSEGRGRGEGTAASTEGDRVTPVESRNTLPRVATPPGRDRSRRESSLVGDRRSNEQKPANEGVWNAAVERSRRGGRSSDPR